ncbi:hypothetical protein PRZ48_001830 [Zasmidium cellare]|uniref:Uncharacterized protein n=1 Tax=Zasmidium cellare TaxID=395010 RepID=A0ABR0F2B9_ZASCE|nr:hypothetical protein PRZ48_001830 [Zasmidium cellare]
MAAAKSFTYALLEELGEEHHLGCKCCRFNKGIDLPVPRKLSIQETTQCARELSTSIFKHWTQLNAIIKRFEGIIQKRWTKKGFKQRRELLVKAWPKISTTHRPDFENFRNSKKQASRSRTCHSEAYLWPYINLEDLQQKLPLLLFLNSRARNLPETFRLADLRAAHLGEGWIPDLDFGDIILCNKRDKEAFYKYNGVDLQCMLFQKKCSPAGYGKVVDRTVTRIAGSQLKYLARSTEGLLALEIQEGIYRFLHNCVNLVLHDIPPSMFFLAPHQPEPVTPSDLKPNEWPSLSNYALEAPYRVPQKLSLDRLKTLVSARRSMAEDACWMLREDPAYFMDNLREWNEHSGQKFKPAHCSCVACWNRIAGRMTTQAFVSLVCWGDIHDKLQAMPPIEVQIKRANEHRLRLSHGDEDRWSALYEVITNLREYSMLFLANGLPMSPRLRHRYQWTGSDEHGEWQMSSGSSEAERRVDQLFNSMKRPDLHGLHGVVQEFQYMLETDSEASHLIDHWVLEQFSDVALLSELTQSIDGLAPWFDVNKAAMLQSVISVETQVKEVRDLTIDLMDGITSVCKASELLWNPLKKQEFDYPVDKRHSKANVDQMIKAEQNLDMFWWSLEVALTDHSGIDLNEILEEQTSPPRELYRTPPYKEPIQLPTPQATPQKPLVEIDPNIQRSSEKSTLSPQSFQATPTKEKVKTRGKPAAPDPRRQPPPAEANNVATPPIEKVTISKRAFKIFQALLPSAKEVVQQRCEIAWDELLWAMDVVGLEPEKLYGSVWIFKPLPKDQQGPGKVKLDRSIQFHEPKEVRRGAKIARPMVRTFGARLRHAFGWTDADEVFECE